MDFGASSEASSVRTSLLSSNYNLPSSIADSDNAVEAAMDVMKGVDVENGSTSDTLSNETLK